MPPKKKAEAKKRAVPKKKAIAKKKAAPKKKAVPKKKAAPKKPIVAVKEAPTIEAETRAEVISPEPEKTITGPPKELVECSHCQGTGKCTAGEIFDKDRHQSLFQEQRLTSCLECLFAAGKARNSKKLVICRICRGTGKVEKTD